MSRYGNCDDFLHCSVKYNATIFSVFHDNHVSRKHKKRDTMIIDTKCV